MLFSILNKETINGPAIQYIITIFANSHFICFEQQMDCYITLITLQIPKTWCTRMMSDADR